MVPGAVTPRLTGDIEQTAFGAAFRAALRAALRDRDGDGGPPRQVRIAARAARAPSATSAPSAPIPTNRNPISSRPGTTAGS